MRRLVWIGVMLSACGWLACSSNLRDSSFSSGSSDSGTGGLFGGSDAGGFGSSSGGGGAGCSEAAKLVYVVSDGAELYSFEPASLKFTLKGTLKCPGIATPNSMAIDRSGTAWVNYSDGSLFKVSTKDASCSATPFAPGQSGFKRVGMAFASDTAGSQSETLYVVGIDDLAGRGRGLAKIDLTTFKLTTIGDFSGSLRGLGAELTGTGDAKLYGFFTTSPSATLAQIDKSGAQTSGDKSLTGVNTGLAWAFSFWGGDFWFYTSDGLTPSKVSRLKTSSDGSISTAVANVCGIRIVGAGVSTCAPLTPPK